MNRSTYLDCPDVRDFVEWSANLATGDWGLVQCWQSKDPRTWCCTSLYDAHKRYSWGGKDFNQPVVLLDRFRRELRDATVAGKDEFVKVALEICKWGGINNNPGLKDLDELGFQQIKNNANRLDPKHGDTDSLKSFKFIGSIAAPGRGHGPTRRRG